MIHLELRGQTHKPYYSPGSVVKCTLSSSCRDAPPLVRTEDKGSFVAYDPSRYEETVYPTDGMNDSNVARINRLTAQCYGLCATDASRMVPSSARLTKPITPPPSPGTGGPGNSDTLETVFASPVKEVLKGETLKHLAGATTIILRFILPPTLPPTYRGEVVRFHYFVHCICEWEVGRRASGSGGNITVLKIPIRVVSPLAAISLIRGPYVSPDYDFRLTTAVGPSQPSPVFCSPLSDDIRVDDAISATSQAHSLSTAFVAEQVAELYGKVRPVDYCIRYRNDIIGDFLIFNPVLMLGDCLRGVFNLHPESPHACARFSVSVEAEERVPRKYFRSGTVLPVDSDDYVVTHRTPLDEVDHVLVQSSGTPFSFHFTPANYGQTIRSELVLVEYFVVLNVWCCSHADRAALTRPCSAPIAAAETYDASHHVKALAVNDPVTLRVPLTVLCQQQQQPSMKCGPMIHSAAAVSHD